MPFTAVKCRVTDVRCRPLTREDMLLRATGWAGVLTRPALFVDTDLAYMTKQPDLCSSPTTMLFPAFTDKPQDMHITSPQTSHRMLVEQAGSDGGERALRAALARFGPRFGA